MKLGTDRFPKHELQCVLLTFSEAASGNHLSSWPPALRNPAPVFLKPVCCKGLFCCKNKTKLQEMTSCWQLFCSVGWHPFIISCIPPGTVLFMKPCHCFVTSFWSWIFSEKKYSTWMPCQESLSAYFALGYVFCLQKLWRLSLPINQNPLILRTCIL